MIIYQPELKYKDNEIIVQAKYESKNESNVLWYSFDKDYEEYIVTENADAFLVSLLLLAMKNKEDIEVRAPISARLFYQLNHYLIRALNLANDEWNLIKIQAEKLNDQDLNIASSSGTGISGGVDSFATIVDHLKEKEEFTIDYFTFFNAGSHGEFGGDKALELYKNRLKLMKPYPQEVGKKIINVDTNLNEILMMNHQQTHTIRSIACVLNLQKLFKYYYYASAFRFDHYGFSNVSMANYDLLVLNMLSTESTTFYSAVSQLTRVERIESLIEYDLTYKYLNVCIDSSDNTAANCSKCYKCLRTQLTLELLGMLEKYRDVFDFEIYKKYKDAHIGWLLAQKNSDVLANEVYQLILDKNMHISTKSYIYFMMYRLKDLAKNILPIKFLNKLRRYNNTI